MKVTAQEEYGLRCLLQVAGATDANPVTLTEIAAREAMTVPHVAKIMGLLRHAGLVESVRGRSGGYVLARPADHISVLDVLRSLGERLFDAEYCEKYHGLDDAACVHAGACSIRPVWSQIETIVSDVLRRTTIAELLRMEESALRASLDSRQRSSALLHIEPR
jgi:Rrf2 family protein